MFYIKRLCWFMLLAMPLLASSCGAVFEDGEICPEEPIYRLRLDDSRNMNFADAFAAEVQSVRLYAFDSETQQLVWSKTETDTARLHSGAYQMVLPLPKGTYDLVAWCGLDSEGASFAANKVSANVDNFTKEQLSVRMNYDQMATSDYAHIQHSALTELHNGMLTRQTLAGKDTTLVMRLTRDTNHVNIIMQRSDGTSLDAADFSFAIEADNGLMNYDNTLLPDGLTLYQPFIQHNASTTLGSTAAIAEFSMARLMADAQVRLKVRHKESTIINIPFIPYALMTKGFYHEELGDQEYLDRENRWNLLFFLDENNRWEQGNLYINDWHIVINTPTEI